MCGICGILGASEPDVVDSMMESMKHRGPDDSGKYLDDNVGLGHRRLSIIDLSENGRQPIHNEKENVWVTYNGEIYNFLKIKDELENLGHNFYTDTDTEILVHGFEEWGGNVVKKLRGMYAFVIYDKDKKELFLATDRFGKKPIYYAINEGKFYFASEIKALLKIPGFKAEINLKSLNSYLSLQYVPGPATMLDGVYKLLPAHCATVKDGSIKTWRYWDLNIIPNNDCEFDTATKQVRRLLEESVKMRLMSDVPLGAFLSGGLDSSALVALMTQIMDEPVKTFSIGYGVEGVDETAEAKYVADYLDTDHTQIYTDDKDVVKEFEKMVWHLSEPIGDAALIGAYFLSKETVKKVKVAFGGGGSDELFAGYRAYKYSLMAQSIRDTTPQKLRSLMMPLSHIKSLPYRARKYIRYIASEEGKYFYEGQGILFSDDEKESLVTDEFKIKTKDSNPHDFVKNNFWEKNGDKKLNRLLYTDLKSWLSFNCMAQVDGMSMAHSLEARTPFLDYQLFEYCMGLPSNYKMNGWKEKYILKKAVSDILPRHTIEREKRGFTVPTNKWLFKDLWEIAQDCLNDKESFTSKYVKKTELNKLLSKRGDFRVSTKLFGLLIFEKWARLYLGGGK